MPKAGTLPLWAPLDLAKVNIIKQLKTNLTAQVANLQSYTSSSPIDDLKAILQTKQQQQQDNQNSLNNLQELLNEQQANAAIQCVYLKGGNTTEIKKQLLALENSPGYEWILCAGALFVGNEQSLSFVKEVLAL